MRAAEGYVRGAYFIVARRRLSSLEGPRSWGQLGVDRSLPFFPALLKPRPHRVSLAGTSTYGFFRVNSHGDSSRIYVHAKSRLSAHIDLVSSSAYGTSSKQIVGVRRIYKVDTKNPSNVRNSRENSISDRNRWGFQTPRY